MAGNKRPRMKPRKRMKSRSTQRLVKKLSRGPPITGEPYQEPSRPQFRRKMREMEIISRRAQPQWRMTISAPRLIREEGIGGMVSSSWIASLEWKGRWVLMTLLNDYWYNVYIPFNVYEAWYYSPSKGTFFNYNIKGKYKVVRSA